jgi:protein O-mannosyl-transferase
MNEPDLAEPRRPAPALQQHPLRAFLEHPAFIAALLFLITAAVFWPARHFDYINYDDPQYAQSNRHVQQGLTLQSVGWAFTTGDCANWHPLTWLSHMLDAQLFGPGPAGPHLVNVVFHAANTLLLFLLLYGSTGARWPSAFTAALFALHPLHVESVAWISERKDVLSTFFLLLTLLGYVRYALRPQRRRLNYWLAFLSFILGLLSKPMLVTLPFVLLLLDYWPLKRVSSFKFRVAGLDRELETRNQKLETRNAEPETRNQKLETQNQEPETRNSKLKTLGGLLLEKIPFFLASAIFSATTFVAQQKGGAVLALTKISLSLRVENALISYGRYLAKTFWPVPLALPYPYPDRWPWIWVAGSVLLIALLVAAGIWLGRRWPFVATGLFWFLGTLVPVIGLVQVGNQSLADRYTYVPLIGLFVALSWGASALIGRLRIPAWLGGIAALLVLAACVWRTTLQLALWQDSGTLFGHAIACTKNNGIAYDNLGHHFLMQDKLDEAIASYNAALRIQPRDPIALDGMGCCLYSKGNTAEAVQYFQGALNINSNQPNTLFNLGSVLAIQGQYDQAAQCFQAALRLLPDAPDVLSSLGNLAFAQQQFDQALAWYQAAERAAPEIATTHHSLGAVLFSLGRTDEAIAEFKTTLRLNPNYLPSHVALATVYQQQHRLADAAEHLEQILKLDPNNTNAARELQEIRGTR